MSIIRQIPWTGQPQDAALLNPALRSPTCVFLGSSPNFDLARGEATQISNIETVPGLNGIAASSTSAASSNWIKLTANRNLIFPGGSATIAVLRRKTDTTARVATVCGNSGVNRILVHAPYSDGNIYWDFGNDSTGRLSVAYGTITTGWECLVFVAGPTKGREIWRNKLRLASNTSKTLVPTASAVPWYLFGNATDPSDLTENALVVVSSAEWSDAEINAWVDNPYGATFAPRTQRIWAPVAAGGAYSITAQPGSYALSGQTSTITRSRLITASAGSYAYTGQTATVSRSKLITASAGSYALSGQSATLLRSKLITASAGAYTYTGQSATITYTPAGAYTLTAQAGSYAVTGRSATLTKSRVINASAGYYSISGKSASISYSGAAAPAGISSVYFDVLSGRVLVLRARSASASTSSATWTELEVDFGSAPVYTATFTITDASITAASKVQVLPCGKTATGRVSDDWAWDGATFAALPASGSATCYAVFVPGPIVGRRKVQYSVGA